MAVSAPLSAPPLSIYTNVLTRITLLLECVLSLYQLHPCRHIYYIYILTITGTQTYIYIFSPQLRVVLSFSFVEPVSKDQVMTCTSSPLIFTNNTATPPPPRLTHIHIYTSYYEHTYIYTHHNFAAAPPPPRLTPHAPAPWRRGGARTPSARPSQR